MTSLWLHLCHSTLYCLRHLCVTVEKAWLLMWVIVLPSSWRQKAQCIVYESAIAAWYTVSVRILRSYSTGESEALERGALTVIMWESGDSPYLHHYLTFRSKARWLVSLTEEPTLLESAEIAGVSAQVINGGMRISRRVQDGVIDQMHRNSRVTSETWRFVEKRKAKNEQDRYKEREARPL